MLKISFTPIIVFNHYIVGVFVPIFKIAIVGAGPAGYFTAQAFQKVQNEEFSFSIDMIERLPTPWGLVRSGVAPDHPKIKTVSKVFEKIAKEPNFRLFANVELGKDISLKDLRDQYDAVVLATGSAAGRKLGITGEDLENVLSSADFVPWYNAHPDFTNVEVDLNTDTAVVIGAGNVAMDIARMLAINPSELDATDTAEHALTKLKEFLCLTKDKFIPAGRYCLLKTSLLHIGQWKFNSGILDLSCNLFKGNGMSLLKYSILLFNS